ncbi:MAG: hypothetical protein M2R45_05270 [Verrucomicrobia subdivision 3 bacterium]|nr:hypothetical protein [Limisphaerales bacterium]
MTQGFARVAVLGLGGEVAAKRILRRTRCERSFSSNSSPRSYALGRGFPFGLYKQIFPFERPEMRTAKRPSVMGGYTNGIVCERLAPGVRKELREKNLSSSKRPAQAQTSSMLHTGDVEHLKLKEGFIGVIARMRAAG